jgi:hypothetical protein
MCFHGCLHMLSIHMLMHAREIFYRSIYRDDNEEQLPASVTKA